MSTSDKLLLVMHNLCLVGPEKAKTISEIAHATGMRLDKTMNLLKWHETEGHLKSIISQEGSKRFFLTGSGIIRVCSSFT